MSFRTLFAPSGLVGSEDPSTLSKNVSRPLQLPNELVLVDSVSPPDVIDLTQNRFECLFELVDPPQQMTSVGFFKGVTPHRNRSCNGGAR